MAPQDDDTPVSPPPPPPPPARANLRLNVDAFGRAAGSVVSVTPAQRATLKDGDYIEAGPQELGVWGQAPIVID